MRTFRVALTQMNSTVGALAQNADRIIERINEAEQQRADLVAFPELGLTGYPPEDLVLKPEFISDNLREIERIAVAVGDITAVVGFVDTDGRDIYNAAAVMQQGRIVGCHHKFYLPNYSVFDEQRYFKAGSEWTVFTIRGVKVGVNICEDIWYPVGPGTSQAMAGAEVIVNINASPYRAGKHEQRYRMVATRALDQLSYVCYLNLVGGQDELVFEGGSMICDQNGERIAQGRFSRKILCWWTWMWMRCSVRACTTLAVGRAIYQRAPLPVRQEDRRHAAGFSARLCRADAATGTFSPVPDRLAEMYGALVLGTRDYVLKSGFKQVIIGLSGGIDSSLTAAIAVDAFGPENVTGVSMPSRYSSEGSRSDASTLATNLGIRCVTLPVEGIFTAYLETLSGIFENTEQDITEENIQARIRGNLLMALSNKFNWLVLTTGNKSEMSVGYSTLYGDLAGAFSVLKDVFKTTLFELCEWRNRQADREIIPRSVIEKPPSAELRPDQRDEDSLPPYPILDAILKLYVEDDRRSTDIVAQGYEAEIVTRVITLVEQSEYKRRQAPPGVKISTRAFGKDRRLPIANRYRDLPEVADQARLRPVADAADQEAHGLGTPLTNLCRKARER
jgi:NAD+ synthase (glutamine-hydrolysing)